MHSDNPLRFSHVELSYTVHHTYKRYDREQSAQSLEMFFKCQFPMLKPKCSVSLMHTTQHYSDTREMSNEISCLLLNLKP